MTLKSKMKLLNSGYSEVKIFMCTHGLAYMFKSLRCCVRYRCLSEVHEKECVLLLSYMVLKKNTTHLNTREAIFCSHQDFIIT